MVARYKTGDPEPAFPWFAFAYLVPVFLLLFFALGYAVGRPDGAKYDCRDKPAAHP